MFARVIEGDDAVRMVGHARDPDAIEEAVRATDPEYVIVGLEAGALPPSCRRFLDERAKVRLLGVAAVDGRAYLYELKPERLELGSLSPGELIESIRALTAEAA
jgi:hypothetical protein